MSIQRCAVLALTLSLMAVSSAGAQQFGKGKAAPKTKSAEVVSTDLAGDIQLASCNTCGEADGVCADDSCCADMACGDICGEGCGSGCGGGLGLGLLGCQPGQLFIGGEWLYVKTNLSQNVSYVERNLDNATTPQFIYQQFDPSYASNFRAYAGYRLCCCGDEIRFTYSNIETDDADRSPVATQTRTFTGPLEVITPPGTFLNNRTFTSIDNYDLGMSKTIPLGTPLGCCDPCNSCPCPAWDLVWTGAIRYANVNHGSTSTSDFTGNTALAGQERTSTLSTSFDGVGLRTGLLGRRYLGRSGVASVYVKGDISLLVGDVDNVTTNRQFNNPTVTTHSISCLHVIPVTEIEAGGTVCLMRNVSMTAGYFISAWHDLGQRAEYNFDATGTQLNGWDDANILGVHGGFVRAEVGF